MYACGADSEVVSHGGVPADETSTKGKRRYDYERDPIEAVLVHFFAGSGGVGLIPVRDPSGDFMFGT